MKKLHNFLLLLSLCVLVACNKKSGIENEAFEFTNVTGSIVDLNGEKVLKVERDLKALPFDINNLAATVDGPQYAKLKNSDFENGTIEVKVLSRIQKNTPYPDSWGFIGLAFRITDNNSAFESIYVRPKVGRAANEGARNEAVQYFSYPNYKMDNIGRTPGGPFEASADIGLNEWITMRIEVEGQQAALYINDKNEPVITIKNRRPDVSAC